MDLPTLSHRFPIWVFHSSFTKIWKQNSLIVWMQLVWSVWSKYPPYETFSSVSTFGHVRPLYVKVIIMHVLFIIAYVDELLWTTTRALIDHCLAWERINLNRKWYIFLKCIYFMKDMKHALKLKSLTFHCV